MSGELDHSWPTWIFQKRLCYFDLGRTVWSLNYWRVRFKSSDRAQKTLLHDTAFFLLAPTEVGHAWGRIIETHHLPSNISQVLHEFPGTWNHHFSWLSFPDFRPRLRLGQFAKVQHTSGKTSGKNKDGMLSKMACWPKMKVQPPWLLFKKKNQSLISQRPATAKPLLFCETTPSLKVEQRWEETCNQETSAGLKNRSSNNIIQTFLLSKKTWRPFKKKDSKKSYWIKSRFGAVNLETNLPLQDFCWPRCQHGGGQECPTGLVRYR